MRVLVWVCLHVIGGIYSFVCVCECVCLFMCVYSVVPLQDHLRWCSLRLADCSDTHSDCRRKIGYVWVWWEAQHLIEILHATHDKRGWGLLYVAADKPEIARSVAVDNGKILESVTHITNAFLCTYIDKHLVFIAILQLFFSAILQLQVVQTSLYSRCSNFSACCFFIAILQLQVVQTSLYMHHEEQFLRVPG